MIQSLTSSMTSNAEETSAEREEKRRLFQIVHEGNSEKLEKFFLIEHTHAESIQYINAKDESNQVSVCDERELYNTKVWNCL